LIAAGIARSPTNTKPLPAVIGLLNLVPWAALLPIAIANGLPEAVAAALITLAVVAAWQRFAIGKRRGANL
jgi:hypothetical protein